MQQFGEKRSLYKNGSKVNSWVGTWKWMIRQRQNASDSGWLVLGTNVPALPI